MSIRCIEAGRVSGIRSQALYHGLAHAWAEGSQDTIVLATPVDRYVSIGFHQDLEHEVDVGFCRRNGLGILRREVGGGAVLLDENQLFVQWIMSPRRLPGRIERRYEVFVDAIVATYADFGIRASFRAVNDVHVGGRKIGGTAAGRIGEAEVLVGNFIFDFDVETMSRVLRVPSEAYREMVQRSLATCMTTMRAELETVPGRLEVANRYRSKCREALRADVIDGELTRDELVAIEEAEGRLGSEEFLRQPGGLRRAGVKIHQDVWVGEALRRVGGGFARVTARIKDRRIEDLVLGCEGGLPATGITDLRELLRGRVLEEGVVTAAVRAWLAGVAAPRGGADEVEWVRAVMGLLEPRESPDSPNSSVRVVDG